MCVGVGVFDPECVVGDLIAVAPHSPPHVPNAFSKPTTGRTPASQDGYGGLFLPELAVGPIVMERSEATQTAKVWQQ